MKARFFFIMIGMFLITGIADVQAQSLQAYLNDDANSFLRIEIQPVLPTVNPPTSFLGKLRSWLGIRQVARFKPPIGTVFVVQASAYASSPYQTDSTPCITATGTRVREGVVASNFLPMGTILEIGQEKFIVEDRMASRYNGYIVDIWFPSTSRALEFGRKKLNIKVVAYGEVGQDVRAKAEPAPAPKQVQKNQLGFWGRVKNNVISLSDFITAKVAGDANRHDVNCDKQPEGEVS